MNSYKTFIETNIFTQRWFELNLTDGDLIRLQQELIKNPAVGKVIPGTGSLRKMRIPLKAKGKQSGARVCYVNYVSLDTIVLICVYAKSDSVDLTTDEKKMFKQLIHRLEEELK